MCPISVSLTEYNCGSLVNFCALGKKETNRSHPPSLIRVHSETNFLSLCCGDGELSLVSHCGDRVRPWLPQHPVPVFTPCGLAQEQPQQPGVGHHLHHASAAAPAASPRAQVRANSRHPSRVPTRFSVECTWGTEQQRLARLGLGSRRRDETWWGCVTQERCRSKWRVKAIIKPSGFILRLLCCCFHWLQYFGDMRFIHRKLTPFT